MNWSASNSRSLYRIEQWGDLYYDVSSEGSLVVRPFGDNSTEIKLSDISNMARDNGICLPLVVRFTNILQHRVHCLYESFRSAITLLDYKGSYCACYPIKVNQKRAVLEAITENSGITIGFEAGSKTELIASLAYASKGSSIICNGYKDNSFIRMALNGIKFGHAIYIVIEKEFEVDTIIEESMSLGIKPNIGLRIRLSSPSSTRWSDTGGDKGKFGLSASQLMRVTTKLNNAGLLGCVKLLHFHMGSQVSNLEDYRAVFREAIRHYESLRALDCPLDTIDIGGGLGVNYGDAENAKSFSKNYELDSYALTVIGIMKELCDAHNLPHPQIISETGRALTAHHAVLLFDVIAEEKKAHQAIDMRNCPTVTQDIIWLQKAACGKTNGALAETYYRATRHFHTICDGFVDGQVDLASKAIAEQLYISICEQLRETLRSGGANNPEIEKELDGKLSDNYICNFSIFKSMADSWAIGQAFPIVPITRLAERPDRSVVLQDLTCDSDGKIQKYVSKCGLESNIQLHNIKTGHQYVLGAFLVGAYQETLGSKHNLFGRTNVVSVHIDIDGKMKMVCLSSSETSEDILKQVTIDPLEVIRRCKQKLSHSNNDSDDLLGDLNDIAENLKRSPYFSPKQST